RHCPKTQHIPRFCVHTKSHQTFRPGMTGPQSGETAMLSWDEFDKPEEGQTLAQPASAPNAAAQGLEHLDGQAAGIVQQARAVAADDSAAVARAKAALNALDIQEGLDELEGSSARVQVGDKQMIN